MQPMNFPNDRKIPPPIGTERLARIRQSGTCAFGNTYTPSVGQNGIWSFGVNGAPGKNADHFKLIQAHIVIDTT